MHLHEDVAPRAVQERLPDLMRQRLDLPQVGPPTFNLPQRYPTAWNSVALFFNLDERAADRPEGYAVTTVAGARTFLDEGPDALTPGISLSIAQYWGTLSYGQFVFGLDTPRDGSDMPLVPTVDVPSGGAQDWGALIRACIRANPQATWEASGRLMLGAKRWIPSVVLVQNYNIRAEAFFTGFDITAGGHDYHVGDSTHIQFGLDTWSPSDAPSKIGRSWWGTLNHEYSHNFLEFADLYGPAGCTGYWDLLGDSSPPGRMSEISSIFKERNGWLTYKQVLIGPSISARNLPLKPYTTSSEAYKITPDQLHTPHEYFVLEYRKSTGDEVWRPDGALTEEGLLITHVSERMGVPRTWLWRDSPYFNLEFADDGGPNVVDWTGHGDLNGKLFPRGAKNSFTPATSPSSNLYGPRHSGLEITNIRIDRGRVKFTLSMRGSHSVGWTVKNRDRALAGRFTPDANQSGEEISIRSDGWAGLLKWRGNRFTVLWMDKEKLAHIDGNDDLAMPLAASDRHYAGRFRPDRDGVLLRKDRAGSGEHANKGLYFIHWDGTAMKWVKRIKSRFNNRWHLSSGDKFVLGDFHRLGPDIADGPRDYALDGLTDIFLHNGWSSGMVGVNFRPGEETDGIGIDQLAMTWVKRGSLVNL